MNPQKEAYSDKLPLFPLWENPEPSNSRESETVDLTGDVAEVKLKQKGVDLTDETSGAEQPKGLPIYEPRYPAADLELLVRYHPELDFPADIDLQAANLDTYLKSSGQYRHEMNDEEKLAFIRANPPGKAGSRLQYYPTWFRDAMVMKNEKRIEREAMEGVLNRGQQRGEGTSVVTAGNGMQGSGQPLRSPKIKDEEEEDDSKKVLRQLDDKSSEKSNWSPEIKEEEEEEDSSTFLKRFDDIGHHECN